MPINYYTTYNSAGGFTTVQDPYAEKASSVNTETVFVRLKAGYVGQVVLVATGEVLWESKPKKTREKAQKAADEAHLDGVRDVYAYIEKR